MNTMTRLTKKFISLIALIALVIAPAAGFAEEATTTTTNNSKVIGGTRVITNTYNAFGSLMSSTEVSDQTTQTTVASTTTQPDGTKDTKETTSYSVQHTETTSAWIGGSLKTISVTGKVATGGDKESAAQAASGQINKPAANEDGSWSVTEFANIYQYDDNGRLTGVAGGIETTDKNGNKVMASSVTKGCSGEDGNGDLMGNYESYTVDTYEIRNGQALKTESTSYSKTYGVDDQAGTVVSESKTTTTYDYDLMGGSWVMTSMTEKSRSDTVSGASKGSYTEQEKVTTYHRNADGTLIDDYVIDSKGEKTYKAITVELKKYTSYEATSGESGYTWKVNSGNFYYVVAFDEQQGYYIQTESITQTLEQ